MSVIPKPERDPLIVYVQYERHNISVMFKEMLEVDTISLYPEQLKTLLGNTIAFSSYAMREMDSDEIAERLMANLTLWLTRTSHGEIFPFQSLINHLRYFVRDMTVQNYLFALDEFVYTDKHLLRIYEERGKK